MSEDTNNVLLNDHPLTQSDKNNDSAKCHQGHKVQKMGSEIERSHVVPQRSYTIQRWLCLDCRVAFQTTNWHDDEDKKDKKTIVED
jgi:hypothetical protein